MQRSPGSHSRAACVVWCQDLPCLIDSDACVRPSLETCAVQARPALTYQVAIASRTNAKTSKLGFGIAERYDVPRTIVDQHDAIVEHCKDVECPRGTCLPKPHLSFIDPVDFQLDRFSDFLGNFPFILASQSEDLGFFAFRTLFLGYFFISGFYLHLQNLSYHQSVSVLSCDFWFIQNRVGFPTRPPSPVLIVLLKTRDSSFPSQIFGNFKFQTFLAIFRITFKLSYLSFGKRGYLYLFRYLLIYGYVAHHMTDVFSWF